MAKPAAAKKIRNFLVRVDLSTLKLTFFIKILDGYIEFIVKTIFQKKSGRNVNLNHLKKGQTDSGNEISSPFCLRRFKTLKINFLPFFLVI